MDCYLKKGTSDPEEMPNWTSGIMADGPPVPTPPTPPTPLTAYTEVATRLDTNAADQLDGGMKDRCNGEADMTKCARKVESSGRASWPIHEGL